MRPAEIRVLATSVVAVCVSVAAASGLVVHRGAADFSAMAPSAALLGLAALSVILGFIAFRRDWLAHLKRMLAEVQASVAASGETSPAVQRDRIVGPVVADVRDQVTRMRTQIQELQVQRKNLEIQLRLADAQRRQSETMINGISDAMLVTNGFDELALANPAAAELFEFSLATSIRKPITEMLGSSRLAADIADLRTAPSRSNRRSWETVLPCNGVQRHFEVTMTCVMDGADQFSGVVTVLHDITREKEVSKMKSDFVSHVSHELRTPLSSIKAYAELLVDGEATDNKTRQEFYHVIQGEADRLSRLIDNILNISRIESGMTRVNKKAISLTAVLKEVLEVAMPSARDKQITLVDQIVPAFFQIEADRDMIYQAALNLISNAIKYTPAGGTVKVSASADEGKGEVTMLVADTGVGIPPDAMKHLFEKFFRVEQHKNMAKGSGLGLNLTRQIVETIHKGRMIVESTLGKGSTFGFALPILP